MTALVTSSGVVCLSEDGLVYVRKVTGGFGGYVWSFAKGKLVAGLSLEDNALKELREEMGLDARILGRLGDYKGTTGTTRFFIGVVTGGDIATHGWETEEVRLVTHDEARALLNMPNDRDVLEDLYRWRPER